MLAVLDDGLLKRDNRRGVQAYRTLTEAQFIFSVCIRECANMFVALHVHRTRQESSGMVLEVLSSLPGAYGVLKVSSSVDASEKVGSWETVTLRRTNLLCELYRVWISIRGVTLVQGGEDACPNGC